LDFNNGNFMGVPLIYTIKGNLPLADLRQEVVWDVSDDKIIFTESYFLGDECVKKSAHVKFLTGVAMSGVTAY